MKFEKQLSDVYAIQITQPKRRVIKVKFSDDVRVLKHGTITFVKRWFRAPRLIVEDWHLEGIPID